MVGGLYATERLPWLGSALLFASGFTTLWSVAVSFGAEPPWVTSVALGVAIATGVTIGWRRFGREAKAAASERGRGRVDPLASWLAQTRKGIVELFVLELLDSRGRMHGYGIVQALDELGDLVAGLSTVYPVLKRLEADGLVDGRRGRPTRPAIPRKYYELTPDGAAFLTRAQAEWRRIGEAMEALRGEDA